MLDFSSLQGRLVEILNFELVEVDDARETEGNCPGGSIHDR